MKTIAFDIDETLNHFIKELLLYIKLCRLNCKVNFEDIKTYNLTKTLPFTESELWYFIDQFKEIGAYSKLKPNKKILEWFIENGQKAHFIALTACSLHTTHISADWLFKHFGIWIRGFYVVPSNRLQRPILYDKTKADFLLRNKVDAIVEDCPENCEEAEKLGIKTFLLKKPWNKGEKEEVLLKKLTDFLEK